MDAIKKGLVIVLQLAALAVFVITGLWFFAKLFNNSNNYLWQQIQLVVSNPKKDSEVQTANDLKSALDHILHPKDK